VQIFVKQSPRSEFPKEEKVLPLHCTALHCTALHCTALHCTALHGTALTTNPEFWLHSLLFQTYLPLY
jgi:hypothetical protein